MLLFDFLNYLYGSSRFSIGIATYVWAFLRHDAASCTGKPQVCRSAQSLQFFVADSMLASKIFECLQDSYRNPSKSIEQSFFLSKAVWGLIFKGFTSLWHHYKDRNDVPDPLGYKRTSFYLGKHIKTSCFMFSKFLILATKPRKPSCCPRLSTIWNLSLWYGHTKLNKHSQTHVKTIGNPNKSENHKWMLMCSNQRITDY